MKALDEKDYYSYDDLIESFEVETLARADDDDYQGDTFLLVRDGNRLGLITFGWGSCSGCDALEAAGNVGEVTELRDSIWNGAHWESDADAMLAYVNGRDWGLDWRGHSSAGVKFIAEMKALLAA